MTTDTIPPRPWKVKTVPKASQCEPWGVYIEAANGDSVTYITNLRSIAAERKVLELICKLVNGVGSWPEERLKELGLEEFL